MESRQRFFINEGLLIIEVCSYMVAGAGFIAAPRIALWITSVIPPTASADAEPGRRGERQLSVLPGGPVRPGWGGRMVNRP